MRIRLSSVAFLAALLVACAHARPSPTPDSPVTAGETELTCPDRDPNDCVGGVKTIDPTSMIVASPAPATPGPGLPSASLEPFANPVRQQVGGRCSAYAVAAAMEVRWNQQHPDERIDLSETHLFYAQRFRYSARAAVEAARALPILAADDCWREDVYPGTQDNLVARSFKFVIHRLAGKPCAEANGAPGLRITEVRELGQLRAASAAALRSELAAGNPIVLALTTNASLTEDEVVKPGGRVGGEHVVSVLGYRETAEAFELRIRNSWGPKVGDKGYQWLPISYCEAPEHECVAWTIRGVTREPVVDWRKRIP